MKTKYDEPRYQVIKVEDIPYSPYTNRNGNMKRIMKLRPGEALAIRYDTKKCSSYTTLYKKKGYNATTRDNIMYVWKKEKRGRGRPKKLF